MTNGSVFPPTPASSTHFSTTHLSSTSPYQIHAQSSEFIELRSYAQSLLLSLSPPSSSPSVSQPPSLPLRRMSSIGSGLGLGMGRVEMGSRKDDDDEAEETMRCRETVEVLTRNQKRSTCCLLIHCIWTLARLTELSYGSFLRYRERRGQSGCAHIRKVFLSIRRDYSGCCRHQQ